MENIILIVDDHPKTRKALTQVLENLGDQTLIHEAGTVRTGVRKAEDLQPALILLDLYLPDGDWVDFIRRKHELFSRSRILVLASSKEKPHGGQAMPAGVNGYLLKDTPPEQILLLVRSVLSGVASTASYSLLFHEECQESC